MIDHVGYESDRLVTVRLSRISIGYGQNHVCQFLFDRAVRMKSGLPEGRPDQSNEVEGPGTPVE